MPFDGVKYECGRREMSFTSRLALFKVILQNILLQNNL